MTDVLIGNILLQLDETNEHTAVAASPVQVLIGRMLILTSVRRIEPRGYHSRYVVD